MMRKIHFVLIVSVIILGCSSSDDTIEENIKGDWAFIDDENFYCELYIRDQSLSFYHEEMKDFFGELNYKYIGDSLFYNGVKYHVLHDTENYITLSNQDYNLHLVRIEVLKADTINAINPFYLRRCNYLVNKGIISMSEGITYLNKFVFDSVFYPQDELLFINESKSDSLIKY